MLTLYNKEHIKLKFLKTRKEYSIKSTLLTGDRKLSFLLPKHEYIETEMYVRAQGQEYVVKSISPSSTSWLKIECDLNVEELEGKPLDTFETVEKTIKECLDFAFVGTGWIVGSSTVTKRRTIKKTTTTVWSILQDARKTYHVEFEIDSIKKIIHIHERIGSDKGAYFIDGLNIQTLTKQVSSYDFYTQIRPRGKDDLTISSVNGGSEIISDFSFSSKEKLFLWTDQRYTNAQSLMNDALLKLREMSKPLVALSLDVIDLSKVDKRYEILDYALGDTIQVISKEEKINEKTRIVSLVEYPDEPLRNKIEIANSLLKFEDLQEEFQEASKTVSNITSDNGTVDGSTVNGIKSDQISDFSVKVAQVVNLSAMNATIQNLISDKASVQELNAVSAKVGTLEATSISTTQFNAKVAEIENAMILKASIVDLSAATAKISILEANVGTIGTLISGSVSAGSTQTIVLNAKNTTIENALIKSAMIDSLVASKITAGIIDASSIHFKSKTGNMDIYDNTISIRDANRVRVQIGKDASSDYNMYVWDNTGKLMFDATGLKADGIKGKIIRDDMVSDSANINGSKLNIASVVTGINNGTSSIKSSHIMYDPTGQTLNVAFNSLSTKLDNIDIGERNLYKLTRNFKDTTGMFISLGAGSVGSLAIENGIMVIDKAVGGSWFYLGKSLCTIPKYEVGKQYTLTMRLKSNFKGASINVSIKFGNGTGSAGVFGDFKCTTEYQTISRTMTAVEGKATELYISFSNVAKYYIEWIKVTEGNMGSDWSPAPEEVEDKIVALSTSLTVEQGKISGLISESTQIKGDVSSLNTKYTSIEATVKGLDVKVGEQTTSLSTITNTVSANKANWDKAGNALATAESAKNSIDGLKIGGRNLAQKTTSSFSTPFSSFTGILNECRTLAVVLADGLQIGDSISIRLIYKYTNIVATAGQTAKFLIQGYGETTGYARGWFPQSKQYTIVGSGEVEIEYQATINAAHLENTKWVANIRHDNIQSGAVQWKMFKVEKGNQYSDWSPAPEDTENLITTEIKTVTDKQASFDVTLDGIKGQVSSTESKVTTVTNTANNALTNANNANSKFDNLQIGSRNLILNSDTLSKYTSMFQTYRAIVTEVGDLSALSKKHTEFKCTTAGAGFWLNVFRKTTDHVGKKYTWSFWAKCSVNKSGSIGHESGGMKVVSITTEWQQFTHTWTMSNHAYTSFIFYLNYLVDEILYIRDFIIVEGDKAPSWVPAPEDIENRITTEIKTVTDKQASLDVTLDGISGRVSSTESRVATVSDGLNNLQIGARNLARGTGTTQTFSRFTGVANTTSNLYNVWLSSDLAVGDKITLSFDYEYTNLVGVAGKTPSGWTQGTGNVTGWEDAGQFPGVIGLPAVGTGKIRCLRTVALRAEHLKNSHWTAGIRYDWVQSGTVTISNFKFERGDKATSWSPAPEDIDSRITTEIKTVTDKQALFDVTLSGITGRVSSTETNVTSITNNFNSLQVGSSNIFKTSGQFTDIASLKSNWSNGGGGLSITSAIQYLGYNTIQSNVGGGFYGVWYKLETGVEYTYAIMIRSTKAFTGTDLSPLHYWTGIDNVKGGSLVIVKRDNSYAVPNTWKLLYITFKLLGDVNSFRPYVYAQGSQDFGVFNIAYMTLTKGNKPLIDWSPAPEEVTGSITDTKTKLADLSLNYDGFKTTVSETYTTKNDFNNLQVGINNLIRNTAPRNLTDWVSWLNTTGTTTIIDEPTALSGKAIKVMIATPGRGFHKPPKKVIDQGKTYTWSCWMKASKAMTLGQVGAERGGLRSCNITTNWQRFTRTFVASNSSTASFVWYDTFTVGDVFYIHSLIMVEGTKTPDWCEAPEDLNGIVTGIQTNVSTFNQTVSSITSTVEKKVDKTSIISSINQTAEAIKISANKLQLTGAVTISMLENSLKNTINTAKDDSYKAFIMARAMAQGRMLFTDPTFLRGYNGVAAYNNAANGNVSVARAGRHSAIADCPSPYYIEVQSRGVANPGWGGFHFGNQSSANHTYVYKIVAKIPSDRYISWGANAYGDGSTMMWLTSQDGTDRFEEYICVVKAGATGTFSSIGFFYLQGGSSPRYWWLGYATCWDLNTEPLENEWTQGTTKINGGYIQTGTITADHISSNTLYGTTIIGGSISSNSTISVSTNLKVGDHIYLGDQNTFGIKRIHLNANNYISFQNALSFSSGGRLLWYEGQDGSSMAFRPAEASRDIFHLGTNYARWRDVYAVRGSIDTSDRNKKHDICPIDDKYKKLFMDLKPVSYKFNENKHNRIHTGFVSQDVEASLNKFGMDGLDFAGFCKEQAVTVTTDKDGGETMVPKVENGEPVYDYSLRYTEFISLNTAMIQDTIKSVRSLRDYMDNELFIANVHQEQGLQELAQKHKTEVQRLKVNLEHEINKLKDKIKLLESK